MSNPVSSLSREQICAALEELNAHLVQKGVTGELCIYGGATMILAFDARQSTRDVDAVFVPKGEISEAAEHVADALGLPADWLNDGVKGFISAKGELTDEGMPQWSNVRILRPSTRYLLAMKCLASRVAGYDTGGDRGDVLLLCRELGLSDASEVMDIVSSYYSAQLIPAKTAFFIEELVEELKGGQP